VKEVIVLHGEAAFRAGFGQTRSNPRLSDSRDVFQNHRANILCPLREASGCAGGSIQNTLLVHAFGAP
jgi:hypothetical protein